MSSAIETVPARRPVPVALDMADPDVDRAERLAADYAAALDAAGRAGARS